MAGTRTEANCLEAAVAEAMSYPYRYGYLTGLVNRAASAARLGHAELAMEYIADAAKYIREGE